MIDPHAKTYIPLEEQMNIWTHAASFAASVIGMIVLICVSRGTVAVTASVIYGVSLCIMFLGSTLYHAAKVPEKRAALRLLDHSAIYLLIAGTYTPLMLIALPNAWGYAVLAAVWSIGIIGLIFELLRKKPFKGFSILLYVLMGWACMAVLPKLVASMKMLDPNSFQCLLWGGIAYTAGIPFYVTRKNYSHAIWHVFTIFGAVLHFLAIYLICRAAA